MTINNYYEKIHQKEIENGALKLIDIDLFFQRIALEKKIYDDFELVEDLTIRNFRIVRQEGTRKVSRSIKHYNLQMIIAIGFKVDNERAVNFRKWTTQRDPPFLSW